MAEITLLSESYEVPQLPEELPELQSSISRKAELIETGARPQPPIFGLIPRSPQKLAPQERFELLDSLVKEYDQVIHHLQVHQENYQGFFAALAQGLKKVVGKKALHVEELERKRRHLEKLATERGDAKLQGRAEELLERLRNSVRVMGHATLLMLRKIDLCGKGLEKLSEDQTSQKDVLQKLVESVKSHRDMYQLEREVAQLEREVETLRQQALGFEGYVRDYFGPLQGVIQEVCTVDQQLQLAVHEIEQITRSLEYEQTPLLGTQQDEQLLDFLVHTNLKKDRLLDVMNAIDDTTGGQERMELALANTSDASLRDAMSNISGLLNLRMESSFGQRYIEEARENDSPASWRKYLREFPDGRFAEEAQQALKRLEETAYGFARKESTAAAWKAYVDSFPTGRNISEAAERHALFRARELNTKEAWRTYVDAYQEGDATAEAEEALAKLEWIPDWSSAHGEVGPWNGGKWSELTVEGVTQRFRLIEPGTFTQGSPEDEAGRRSHETLHEVTIGQPFWIADTPCTQAFWQAVTGENPSVYGGANRPVDSVSWNDCQTFFEKLNDRVSGLAAGMPTEAQWEYACRAGTRTPFAGDLDELGWHRNNTSQKDGTVPVKKLKPNGWRLYDMHGNVSEWCRDTRLPYPESPQLDPVLNKGEPHVIRGGGWNQSADQCRSAHRGIAPRKRSNFVGFRIVAPGVLHGIDLAERLSVEPENAVFLGSLDPISSKSDLPEPIMVNQGWRSAHRHVIVGGRRCESFVHFHAPARAVYRIPPGTRRFTAVGAGTLDTEALHRTWRFQIYVDEEMVFDSPPLYEQRGGIPIDIPLLRNSREVTIVVDPMDDHEWDTAALAWPYFHPLTEEQAYRETQVEPSARAWHVFLSRYPTGQYVAEAMKELAEYEDEVLERARSEKSVTAWCAYRDFYPRGVAIAEANEALASLEERTWQRAHLSSAVEDWHAYVEAFPNGKYILEALEGEAFAKALEKNTPLAWRRFIESFPSGRFSPRARMELDRMAWVPEWAAAWGEDDRPNGKLWADLEVGEAVQRFRLIEPSTFLMGSPTEEPRRSSDERLHEVTITQPYWMADTPCTQSLWRAVMGANPSYFKGDDRPVESVSWQDCQRFLQELGSRVQGLKARLPSEAEWEYACRAGNDGPYGGSGVMAEMGWSRENAGKEHHPVKQLRPNAWGLYDMHGNVMEYCRDAYTAYSGQKRVDPVGQGTGQRVARGGAWNQPADECRSASRSRYDDTTRRDCRGLRLAIPSRRLMPRRLKAYSIIGEQSVFIGDLHCYAETIHHPVLVNRTPTSEDRINVAGLGCDTYLCVHAPARLRYAIPAGARRFTAVGAGGEQPETLHRTWQYRISVDGVPADQSDPLFERRGGLPIEVSLPPGARELAIHIDPLGDQEHDQTILAWPCFHRDPSPIEGLIRIPKSAVDLIDLEPADPESRAAIRVNEGVEGYDRVAVADVPCWDYILTPAGRTITYKIPESALRFTAIATRTCHPKGAHRHWRYQVLIGHRVIFDSLALHSVPEGIAVDVPLPLDADEISLRVVAEDNELFADPVWAWPCFRTEPWLDKWKTSPKWFREPPLLEPADIVRLEPRPTDIKTVARAGREAVFLGDLKPWREEVGFGKLMVNEGWFGNDRVLVDHKSCDTYLNIHAPADVIYDIPRDACRFTAVGARLDDEDCAHGTWSYRILIDRQMIFCSDPFHRTPTGLPIDIPIPPYAKKLQIIVDSCGDDASDLSMLAYPYFHFKDVPPPVPEHCDDAGITLLQYDAENGDTSLIRMDPQLPNPVERMATKWNTGWSHVEPLLWIEDTGLFCLDGNSGRAQIIAFQEDTPSERELWKGTIEGAWTHVRCFGLDGRPHTVFYDSASGSIEISRIEKDSGPVSLWRSKWSEGWSHVVPLRLDQDVCLMKYNRAEGTLKIDRVLPDGRGAMKFWSGRWAPDWTHIEPLMHGQDAYVAKYNRDSGTVVLEHILPGAQGIRETGREHLETGWDISASTVTRGQGHLLLYREKDGVLAVKRMIAAGKGLEEIRRSAAKKGLSHLTAIQQPLGLKPVLHYRFERGLIREASALKAADLSGHKNSGAIHNAVPVRGRRGTALYFNGRDAYIENFPPPQFESTAFTCAMWVRYDGMLTEGPGACLICQNNAVGRVFQLSTMEGRFHWDRFGEDLRAPDRIETGRWYHVAAVVEGVCHRLFVDGIMQDETRASFLINREVPLHIGRTGAGEKESFFQGLIDEVMVFDEALQPHAIRRLYREGMEWE